MKQVIFITCSIVSIAVAIYINFPNAFTGSPPTLLNRFTSICFTAFWFIFIYLLRNNRKSMFYAFSLSIGLIVTACMLLMYALIEPEERGFSGLLPYILTNIFFVPLYGLRFTNSPVPLDVWMLFLGITGLCSSTVFLRRINKINGIRMGKKNMKQVILIACSIVSIAVAIYINFPNALMGSQATLLNRFTSICFTGFWFIFIYLLRNNRKSMFYAFSLSIGLIVTACMLLVYALAQPTISGIISLIPYALATFFSVPFYGLLFTNSFVSLDVWMLFLGIAGLCSSAVFLRRSNKASKPGNFFHTSL